MKNPAPIALAFFPWWHHFKPRRPADIFLCSRLNATASVTSGLKLAARNTASWTVRVTTSPDLLLQRAGLPLDFHIGFKMRGAVLHKLLLWLNRAMIFRSR
jgi:hypothetical protein